MKKLLSIIIPFYKGDNWIENTVQNLIENQKYEPLEIIIVDDGSLIFNESLFNCLARLDSRIRIERKVNGGIADARNYGIQKANGEYIAFVDQDDLIESDMYSNLISLLEQTGSDMALSNYYSKDLKSGMLKKIEIIKEDRIVEGAELINLRRDKAFGVFMQQIAPAIPSVVWNCVFKKITLCIVI